MAPEYLRKLDRIYQWSLYTAKQALENSGYLNHDKVLSQCGLILGNPTFPTVSSQEIFSRIHHLALQHNIQKLIMRKDFQLVDKSTKQFLDYNAWTVALPARVVAQGLGLHHGPCYTIDAACATSIYILQLASHYLLTGQAKMMLVGAVCCPDYLYVNHGFNVLRAFPPADGHSLPFDISSQGIKIGEGAGFLVLKRYNDAIREGDRIDAVIESIGLSNDGSGQHILTPSSSNQVISLQKAYQQTDRRVDYIECHATGTPLGDKTELETLENFFNEIPLLGGNKANIGHTLTAAAMASIIKVVMSMKKGIIPATIGVNNIIASTNKRIHLQHIVRENRAWEKQEKVAGINAFGFGGVNSHLILSNSIPEPKINRKPLSRNENTLEKIAIVGMHGQWGNINSLEVFNDMIYHCRQNFYPLSSDRWLGVEENTALMQQFGFENKKAPTGCYCDSFELDCIQFKIPPQQADLQLFNHLLMLQVADKALKDAGFSKTNQPRNIAVLVSSKMDWANHRCLTRLKFPWYLQQKLKKYNINLKPDQIAILEEACQQSLCPTSQLEGTTGGIGNLVASRISALWNFTGPSLLISSQENSTYKALQLANFFLQSDPQLEAVVLGAIDLCAGLEHVFWNNRSNKAACSQQKFSWSTSDSGWNIGEGAGAIVVKREKDCQNNRIYARIKSLQILQENSSIQLEHQHKSSYITKVCEKAFHEAKVSPKEIDYLEVHASGIKDEDLAEQAGLIQAYSAQGDCQPVIGSIKANIGHTFVASGMASIIKTALCLYHRYLPGTPIQHNHIDSFVIANHSNSWKNSLRLAAINSLGLDSSYVHAILEEPTLQQREILLQKGSIEEDKKHKTFIKRLSSTWKHMGDFMLQDKYQKAFPVPKLTRRKPPTKDIMKQYVAAALQRNANTQITYSKIKQAMQNSVMNLLQNEFAMGSTIERKPSVQQQRIRKTPQHIVWDYPHIVEMTTGKLSNILGKEYRDLDNRPVRARLPLPPFMFVSRVTKLEATPKQLKPCFINWQYDIPTDAWYITNEMVPGIIPFESSHGLILALSYIGCDYLFSEERYYRALDSTVTFSGNAPLPGDTLEGKAHIHTFIKSGNNLLIFYDYQCFVDGKEILKIKANAGFFSLKSMQNIKRNLQGIDHLIRDSKQQTFSPLLSCPYREFSDEKVMALKQGDFAACFGNKYSQQSPGLLSAPKLDMLDRVLSIDPTGGLWGLGDIIGEKDISSRHWVFAAHFKNDPVLPGTMLVEGCNQLILFYMYYLGLHTPFSLLQVDFVPGTTSSARFRGEVKQKNTKIKLHLQIKEIHIKPEIYVVAIAEIIHQGKIIGICDNISIRFLERNVI